MEIKEIIKETEEMSFGANVVERGILGIYSAYYYIYMYISGGVEPKKRTGSASVNSQ